MLELEFSTEAIDSNSRSKNKDLNVNVLDAKSRELFVKIAKRVSYRQVDQPPRTEVDGCTASALTQAPLRIRFAEDDPREF
jgi:hypothetical protein